MVLVVVGVSAGGEDRGGAATGQAGRRVLAARYRPGGRVGPGLGPADLEPFLTGNFKGTYFTTQAVVRQMRAQGPGGRIVNIGTVLVQHPRASAAASAPLASKGGIHALTTALAAELAADGIRVDAVAPGMIRTPMVDGGDLAALGRVALMGRIGEVAETTAAVLYPADATFTTGHILPVDGGFVSGRA